ncbi:hypothetical protein [Sphingobium algorifonticola]|uniref:Sarcosine oxidase subunit gamma n=1 Tax=Sphingobium algorifonticola TaxID=2008318 RepID=A0A437J5Q7_9SPHN|nr:hypothetical protein [Sphingobium algorifonticola]RVT40280.1 hypothetical protein ENE74_13240 [Sphingobium algorifonticola]
MTDTADMMASLDWSGTSIRVTPRHGLSAIRLKATKRGRTLAVDLGLPATGGATEDAIWIGPDEWLLLARPAEEGAIVARLAAQQAQGACYWSAIGDGLVILDLGEAGGLVSQLTGLPQASFALGRAARTRVAGIAVLFAGMSWGTRMIFDRMYDRHIRRWLDAAAE